MTENASEILQKFNKIRSRWVKANRENGFEDSILRLLSDLYPDRAHFIFELLQNAEDARASRVKFQLAEEELIVRHNGHRLFDSQDVDSITSIANSTKKEDVNTIGKFGISFKSVFAYSNTPQVHSGEYNFEVRDLVCPYEILRIDKDDQETIFVLPFNNALKPAQSCFDEIKTVFESLDHTILIFLNNIKSIEWDLNGEKIGSAVRENIDDVDERLVKISIKNRANANLQKNTENAWFLKFQKELEEHGNLQCAIAFKLDFRKDSQKILDVNKGLAEQMKIAPADGKLCVFFPAEKEKTGLKIYVNGPYAATIDRASIKHDHEDNQQIFKSTAQLLIEVMEDLKKVDLLNPDFLEILPNNDDQLEPFYDAMKDTVYEALSNRALLPCSGGGYGKAGELARGPKAIIDVVGEDALAILFDDEKKQWAAGVMRNSRSDKLLESLDIPYYSHGELIDAVDNKYSKHYAWMTTNKEALVWLQKRPINWLQSFYLLLRKVVKREDREWQVKNWKIIKTQNGDLFVGCDLYFPVDGNPLTAELPTVFAEIFGELTKEKEKQLREFLTNAGVNPIGEGEEIKRLLDQFYAENSENSEENQHLEHIKRFIKWSYGEGNTEVFHDYSLFKNNREEYCKAAQCYIDHPFEKTGLSAIYSDGTGHDESRSALWEGYIEVKNFVQFSARCGAAKVLDIKQRSVWDSPRCRELYTDGRWTRYGINEDYYIESLEELLEEKNVIIAKIVWQTLIGAKPDVLKARYRANRERPIRCVPSSLVQTLQKTKWIPGKDDKFYSPGEMTKELLKEDFEYDDRNGGLTAICFAEKEQEATEEDRQRKENEKNLLAFCKIIFGVAPDDISFVRKAKKLGLLENLKSQVERSSVPTEFPKRPSADPERRAQRAKERSGQSPKKKYEVRKRSVRVSAPTGDHVTYLEQNYTNNKNQLVCQICENEMPFRRRDGRYYFEAVQLFDDLSREYEAAYVALCPLCAAKFKELVKKDEKQREFLSTKILSIVEFGKEPEESRVSLQFGEETGSIRFVEKHFLDILGFIEGS